MAGQQPIDPVNFDTMMKMFSNADSKDELSEMAMLFILDISYERADIALAIHDIEINRGWH